MSDLKFLTENRPPTAPFQAALVHFPLACLSLATLLDCASWAVSETSFRFALAAFWTLIAGVGAAIASAVLSLIELTRSRASLGTQRPTLIPTVLTLGGILLFVSSIALRSEHLAAIRTPVAAFVASVAGYVLLVFATCLSGRFGPNQRSDRIVRHLTHDAPGARSYDVEFGDVDEYSPVCHVDEFIDGGTLRANIRGTLITIAKSDGEFFAVQEFCTHRFGPLSEGKVENGQITCPWHRACFDLRTGHSVEGCAKVPLRTYAVEVRFNRIYVKVPVRPRSSAT